ncbi:MAG: iron-sulfur cluster assembly accessory protein [Alphaproteobacteria bacterium]|nr:MAG: iron-sulfur cluster assembly accessory protein [Alphaproteobacteria bacterium]
MTKQAIQLTDRAADYIRSLMEEAQSTEKPILGLRVSIKKGGCSGSEYVFDYSTEMVKYDEVIEDKGVRVFIDPAALLKVIGSEMDYEDALFSSGFIFRNPNELGKCGCGKSVQL